MSDGWAASLSAHGQRINPPPLFYNGGLHGVTGVAEFQAEPHQLSFSFRLAVTRLLANASAHRPLIPAFQP